MQPLAFLQAPPLALPLNSYTSDLQAWVTYPQRPSPHLLLLPPLLPLPLPFLFITTPLLRRTRPPISRGPCRICCCCRRGRLRPRYSPRCQPPAPLREPGREYKPRRVCRRRGSSRRRERRCSAPAAVAGESVVRAAEQPAALCSVSVRVATATVACWR